MNATRPLLSGLVAHWHNEEEVEQLIEAWPDDSRFELIVVDNGSARPVATGESQWIDGGGNTGFAGAINRAAQAAQGEFLLILNPDACPTPGALEELLVGFNENPDTAGLAPKLSGDDGSPQFAWQLRQLPTVWHLLRHAAFIPPASPLQAEPEAGTAVEQPAAAALAVRAEVFRQLSGLDQGFHPAWFEDVDFAMRARRAGHTFRYWPAAHFIHGLGSSVPRLGYGRFLWTYYRNLTHYLAKHHGRLAAATACIILPLTSLLRLAALPLRRPSRSASRGQAVVGLLRLSLGALSGWRLPTRYRQPPVNEP